MSRVFAKRDTKMNGMMMIVGKKEAWARRIMVVCTADEEDASVWDGRCGVGWAVHNP